ncbi:MAG TPA: TMEM175 family protein [Ignavibacteria bacterium]|nr:TMEM175 family protein [Ignavibacteria bacterium]
MKQKSDIDINKFEETAENLKISRVESLSDGVFAIAMTLMVLDLKIPTPSDGTNFSNQGIMNLFFSGLETLEKYVISFIVLGIYWIRHQAQFSIIKNANRGLLYINIIFLMFISLIPATTSFLMNYSGYQFPLFIYLLNNFIICLMLLWHLNYAANNYRLIDARIPESAIRKGKLLLLSSPLLFLIAMVISFFSLRISFMILYLLPFIFPFYHIYDKKLKKYKNKN